MNNRNETIKEGLLTTKINPRSQEFKEFKDFMDSRVNELSEYQRNEIELQSMKIRMTDYLNSEITKKDIINSGSFLKDLLKKLGIRQNQFAEFLKIRPSNLSKILTGERIISLELSIILQQLFRIESNVWLRIQTKNKLARISKKEMQSFKKYTLTRLLNKRRKNVG